MFEYCIRYPKSVCSIKTDVQIYQKCTSVVRCIRCNLFYSNDCSLAIPCQYSARNQNIPDPRYSYCDMARVLGTSGSLVVICFTELYLALNSTSISNVTFDPPHTTTTTLLSGVRSGRSFLRHPS